MTQWLKTQQLIVDAVLNKIPFVERHWEFFILVLPFD